jgi:hypothetical protein
VPDPLTHTGPFALGTFRNSAGAFPGLVSGARVRDLSDLVPSVRALVEDWDNWLPRLDEPARSADGPWHPLTALHVLPPSEPGQILQSGANYRKHVVDLVAVVGAVLADQADQGGAVGKDADHVGAAANLLVEAFLRVVRPDLPPALARERGDASALPPTAARSAPRRSARSGPAD